MVLLAADIPVCKSSCFLEKCGEKTIFNDRSSIRQLEMNMAGLEHVESYIQIRRRNIEGGKKSGNRFDCMFDSSAVEVPVIIVMAGKLMLKLDRPAYFDSIDGFAYQRSREKVLLRQLPTIQKHSQRTKS